MTGANYLLEVGQTRVIVDCGLFQGTRYSDDLNYQAFPYDPAHVDAVLITHSHADHMGRLPKLYRDGFRGRVITTEPTAGILTAALPDTMDKMLEAAREVGHPPLYTKSDFRAIMKLVQGVPYRREVTISDTVTATFHEASHILGSAIIEIKVNDHGVHKVIAFSGDLGNPPTILLNPIDYVTNADYALVESAYGNRLHEDRSRRREMLIATIEETVARGGVLMIPSFAVERTQELLLEMDRLFEDGRLPAVPIFVDSPLAISITKIYGEFSRYFNSQAVDILRDNKGLFNFPWLTFTPSSDESKKINEMAAPKIIIAGSGMSQGGRILHHEARYLSDPRNCILFVGYQVKGSLGRRILDGEPQVSIFGTRVPVRCQVRAIPGYSAHADQAGLVAYVRHAQTGGRLKKVFVVQGEEEASAALARKITQELGVPAEVPAPNQSIVL